MAINFSIISTIIKTIADVNTLIDKASKSWTNPKKELDELKIKINFIEKETIKNFPKLAKLIRSYSFA